MNSASIKVELEEDIFDIPTRDTTNGCCPDCARWQTDIGIVEAHATAKRRVWQHQDALSWRVAAVRGKIVFSVTSERYRVRVFASEHDIDQQQR